MRVHGGGLLDNIIDFSVNLNPYHVPDYIDREIRLCILDKEIYKKYPDYNYTELTRAISLFYDINSNYIIVTNGASEGLNLSIITLKPDSLIIISPSYGDYEMLCSALGIKCIYLLMKEDKEEFIIELDKVIKYIEKFRKSLIIITNPNNPTGSIIDNKYIIDIGKEAMKRDSFILIDEVYSELSDHKSILTNYKDLPENFIIVKSFTKLFNIPGLRIGFIYNTNIKLIKKIDYIRPTWNVNSIVECVFKNILVRYKEDLWKFIEESKKYIKKEREYLVNRIRGIGYHVYKSRTNFILLKHKWISSEYLKEFILEKYKILVRPAYSFYGLNQYYTRISVRRHNENILMVKALEELSP